MTLPVQLVAVPHVDFEVADWTPPVSRGTALAAQVHQYLRPALEQAAQEIHDQALERANQAIARVNAHGGVPR